MNGCNKTHLKTSCPFIYIVGGYVECLANEEQRKYVNGLKQECSYFVAGGKVSYRSVLFTEEETLKKETREKVTNDFDSELAWHREQPIIKKKKEQERQDLYDKLLEDD